MKEYFYDVELIWKLEQEGILYSHGMPSIEVLSPKELPREKKAQWTPEHMLAGSVSTSFMATFLGIAEQSKLDVFYYKSQCFLKLEMENGKYITSEILLRPMVRLANELSYPIAYLYLERAKQSCPVINAVKVGVEVHPSFEILVKEGKINV